MGQTTERVDEATTLIQGRPESLSPASVSERHGRAIQARSLRPPATVPGASDRFSFAWLGLGLALLVVGTARWAIPLAAWLYPVFLLRFARSQPPRRGLALVVLAPIPVLAVAWRGFWGQYFPDSLVALVVVLFGLLHALPYLADRLLVPRLGGVLGSLVFPLATTSWWYLFVLVSPWGTQLNPAHTQYGNLPLLQLLSVTGVWGLDFLMAWLASVVNLVWERDFAWPRIRALSLIYAGVLAAALLLGGARLAFFPPQASTVRVAGVSPSRALTDSLPDRMGQLDQARFNAELVAGATTPEERAIVRAAWAPIVDDLLASTEREARAGARIVAWPECGVQGFREDESALLARVGDVARATGAYIDVGLCQVLEAPVGSWVATDENVLVDPNGAVVSRFEKAHPVPGVETTTVPGDGHITVVETPYGRLAGVVCYDADFPDLLRQAALAGADILLAASNDWREIDPYHTQLQAFRAVEQGYSLVRQTSNGLSMTVDYEGNVLAASDYFTADQQTMVAFVPTRGVWTIYVVTGDLFAWLCLAGLGALLVLAILRRPDSQCAAAATPARRPSSASSLGQNMPVRAR